MAAGNTFGTVYKVTLFGESHGEAVGGVVDGYPSGMKIPDDLMQQMLEQRKPTGRDYETERIENDDVVFLSGVKDGITLGSPIAFFIKNKNTRSEDYASIKQVFRPGHSDYSYFMKYGIGPQDGGGRSSGRETAARVVAGALALSFLRLQGIDIISYVSAIGNIEAHESETWPDESALMRSPLNCPDPNASSLMNDLLNDVLQHGDSIGGRIRTRVKNLPAGLGEPVFNKLNALLSQAVFSIPAVTGVVFGDGLKGMDLRGSQYNDSFIAGSIPAHFASNHSGGIQGGISNGAELRMETMFRPASSVKKQQQTITLTGEQSTVEIKGRHDVCFVPRAAIVVTSMTAITIMDLWLQQSLNKAVLI